MFWHTCRHFTLIGEAAVLHAIIRCDLVPMFPQCSTNGRTTSRRFMNMAMCKGVQPCLSMTVGGMPSIRAL
eukprot:4247848-Amphidinium_carterae.1